MLLTLLLSASNVFLIIRNQNIIINGNEALMNVSLARGRLSDNAILSISRDSAEVFRRLNIIESQLVAIQRQHAEGRR